MASGPSSTTYRLQGIPADIGERDIPGLLREAWKLPASTEVTVRSLATSPYRPEQKVATLTFSKTPKALQPGQNEWPCYVNSKLQLVLDTHFHGFTPLHSDPDSECFLDCIAVSGLGGHAFGSFESNIDPGSMWLRDSLPHDLPQSRIFIYGYDAGVVDSTSSKNIADFGMELQQSINQLRPREKGAPRPLVFIGHSLGGSIIKQAVINMHESRAECDQVNLQSLRAALFFAVPNLGVDDITALTIMVQGKPNERLVESLKRPSKPLLEQNHLFDIVSHQVVKHWYYEMKAGEVNPKRRMSGPDELLVDSYSATNGRPVLSVPDSHFVHPMNRTHSEIVKFPHQYDRYYLMVSEHLKDIKIGILQTKGSTIGGRRV